jgi:hypothetical protein
MFDGCERRGWRRVECPHCVPFARLSEQIVAATLRPEMS